MTSTLDRQEIGRLPPASDWRHTLWAVVGILMFGGMLVAALIYTAPALLSDWQIRDTAQPVDVARVSDGSCSSKIMVNICDVTLESETASGTHTRQVNYIFTGVHVGDYSVRILADPRRPELTTTDMGLDKLWNRTITLALLLAVLLTFTVLPIVAAFRNWRAARAA